MGHGFTVSANQAAGGRGCPATGPSAKRNCPIPCLVGASSALSLLKYSAKKVAKKATEKSLKDSISLGPRF